MRCRSFQRGKRNTIQGRDILARNSNYGIGGKDTAVKEPWVENPGGIEIRCSKIVAHSVGGINPNLLTKQP